MNYYDEIKNELINNEIYKKVKDYSKNRSDLEAYFNVGKLLIEAQGGEDRAKYGNAVLKEYAERLTVDVNKKYDIRTLRRIRQFYLLFRNWSTVSTELTWSHYSELLILSDKNIINYYINITVNQRLSVRELRTKIRNKEYERLDDITKEKLVNANNDNHIEDFIKHPIVIRNGYNYEIISEKILKQLILEDIDNFLVELGEGFTYIKNEYKIKIGDRYNFIDLLLFNFKFNCFVVIELKITELKAEHIGQVQKYMNYIDKNMKTIGQDKTLGIIIVRRDNEFVMEYCSDNRIYRTTYELINV